MPTVLSIADFKMFRAVCELRFENPYLIYDRTGHIFHDMARSFTDLKVKDASPNQSLFQSDEGAFALELGQCRFTTDKPDKKLETFASHCKRYFEVVADCLEVKFFSRIGLRVFFRKDFETLDESKAALASLRLVNLGDLLRFGAAEHPEEVMFRWQSSQIGALLRFKADSWTIDLVLPPELEAPNPTIHKVINGLLVDVDYYTVALVERAQWDASAWIPQAIATVKRDVDEILRR